MTGMKNLGDALAALFVITLMSLLGVLMLPA
jgi:hypothetical protein